MEAKNKSVCPYCGSERVAWVTDSEGPGYYGMCLFNGDHSEGCGAEGPSRATKHDAIDAFCHPAHLMENLHTYDPKTQVVVSRETAEHAAKLSKYYHCADPACPCGECEADLKAALSREVEK